MNMYTSDDRLQTGHARVRSIDMEPAESIYYRHSGRVPAASRLSLRARTAVYQRFLRVMAPGPNDRILDIGVTSDTTHPESNFLERAYPWKRQITCVGTEDGSHLEREYPGVRFVRVNAGEAVPFEDGSFDIVFSNAVIEHVGGAARQRAFAAEALRVARRVFLVTPNRWFPFETHTGLPLAHYLPARAFRAVLRRTPYAIWASEDRLNLLTASSLAAVFPPDARVAVEYAGVGVGPLRSNLIAHGARIDDQLTRR
jgi:SAM-dependent methyltransferase